MDSVVHEASNAEWHRQVAYDWAASFPLDDAVSVENTDLATPLAQKARDMRNAIDMIEGAIMGLGDFVELPRIFDGTRDDLQIAPKMTVGEMRRVCAALEECTRIINSSEYNL